MPPRTALPPVTLPTGAAIDAEGVWTQVLRPASGGGPALFVDRDGVVVEEVRYLHRIEDARLVPGAARVIAEANRRAVPVVMVTNQAGIGRGYYGWDAFASVQERILADLAAEDALIDAVYACPHHDDGVPPYDRRDHPARKPNPGMLLSAADALALNLSRSWIIGDRASDLAAGRNAGLAGGVHVRTGYGSEAGERAAALACANRRFRALGAATIADALTLVPLLG